MRKQREYFTDANSFTAKEDRFSSELLLKWHVWGLSGTVAWLSDQSQFTTSWYHYIQQPCTYTASTQAHTVAVSKSICFYHTSEMWVSAVRCVPPQAPVVENGYKMGRRCTIHGTACKQGQTWASVSSDNSTEMQRETVAGG